MSWTLKEDKEMDRLQQKPEPVPPEILHHSSPDLQLEIDKYEEKNGMI